MWLLFWPSGFVALLAIGLFFGRRRYKWPYADRPPRGKGWVETPERFRDPVSHEDVTVWYNTIDGERAYIRRPPPP